MGALEIVLGIILTVLAAVLVVCVMAQQSKEKGLSGTITGSAESFISKGKGKTKEKKLAAATTVLAIVFVVLAVAFGIIVMK